MKYKKLTLIRIEAIQTLLLNLRKKIAHTEISGEDALARIDDINKSILNTLELINLEEDLGR